ncbi:hypothetical protein IMW63_01580 [Ehrlichia ruminantium]|uniref:hypothetical protein n=1 Tax=Ehrlichia ruminantium TaxID=779 RepID=UPI001FB3FF84|nr:hypothetical protein [Ehrlichia ruminantium]UOD99061.1 hypothetical protein IMW63_01580 [Ehrlichia ruminantium]
MIINNRSKVPLILLGILVTIVIIILITYFQFIRPLNKDSFDKYLIGTLYILGAFIFFLALDFIEYHFGFSIKYIGRDQALNIDTSKQSSIFISMSSDELSKIEHEYKITKFSIKDTKSNSSTQIYIEYSAGLLSNITSPGINIHETLLLNTNESIDIIKKREDVSGLLINTENNTLQQQIQGKQITRCIPTLHNNLTLSLSLYYAIFDSSINNLTYYTKQELHDILMSQAICNDTTSNVKQSVYGHIVSKILEECPVTKLDINNPWINTKEGKLAIAFFTKFNPENGFDIDELSMNLTRELNIKLKHITDYVKHLQYSYKLFYQSTKTLDSILQESIKHSETDINEPLMKLINKLKNTLKRIPECTQNSQDIHKLSIKSIIKDLQYQLEDILNYRDHLESTLEHPINDATQDSLALFDALITRLRNPIKSTQNYINNIKYHSKIIQDIEYNKAIISEIRDTYFNTSYDINHYSHLWKNRLSKEGSLRILDILKEKIDQNTELQDICNLAVIDTFDTNTNNQRTNEAIKHILPQPESEPLISITDKMTSMIDANTGLISPDNDLISKNGILPTLFPDNQPCSFHELIEHARHYITTLCKEYMVSYIEREIQINNVQVNNIVWLPEKTTISNQHSIITSPEQVTDLSSTTQYKQS